MSGVIPLEGYTWEPSSYPAYIPLCSVTFLSYYYFYYIYYDPQKHWGNWVVEAAPHALPITYLAEHALVTLLTK